MFAYRRDLKHKARQLRRNMTPSERVLWGRLRGKQLLGVQFCSQRPLGDYIVDFYCPKARLVVEVDGSQHMDGPIAEADAERDNYLRGFGLIVLRFFNREVLTETDAVVEVIFKNIVERLE